MQYVFYQVLTLAKSTSTPIFSSIRSKQKCICVYKEILQKNVRFDTLTPVSVFLPRKPKGGTLQNRCHNQNWELGNENWWGAGDGTFLRDFAGRFFYFE